MDRSRTCRYRSSASSTLLVRGLLLVQLQPVDHSLEKPTSFNSIHLDLIAHKLHRPLHLMCLNMSMHEYKVLSIWQFPENQIHRYTRVRHLQVQYGLWSDYQHEKVECVPRQRTRIGGRQVNIALILDRELWTGEIEEGGNLGEVVVKGRDALSCQK